MVDAKKYIALSVMYLLDTVDVILRFFGIKLYRLTRERILGNLTPEELDETKQKDVALPFQLFMKVCSTQGSFRKYLKCALEHIANFQLLYRNPV